MSTVGSVMPMLPLMLHRRPAPAALESNFAVSIAYLRNEIERWNMSRERTLPKTYLKTQDFVRTIEPVSMVRILNWGLQIRYSTHAADELTSSTTPLSLLPPSFPPFPHLPFCPSLVGSAHAITHLCSLEIQLVLCFNEILFPSF